MRLDKILVGIFIGLFVGLAQAKVEIETWETSAGVGVLFVEAPELPMLDIELKFRAGSYLDEDKLGLANLTSAMVFSGTRDLVEEELAEKFNNLGANFGASASYDSATISLRSLTRESLLSPAMDLLGDVIAQPRFPEDVFNRDKARLEQALLQKMERPDAVASQTFWKALYGEHPYGNPVEGTSTSVAGLKLEDIKSFYSSYYTQENAQITIVGAVSLKEAKRIAEYLSKRLQKGSKAAKPALPSESPLPTASAGGETIKVPFKSAQTHYLLGQLGVERGHKDYYALFLGNHLLGGSGFGSLLMEEVREKRGLVYGVYSYFIPLEAPGPWLIQFSTQTDQLAEADATVEKVLLDFIEDFPEKNFKAIQSNLLGGWPLRVDSNSKILGYISMIGFYDLPLDYLAEFPQAIENLTKQDVLDAWQRFLQQDKLLKVMVGDF